MNSVIRTGDYVRFSNGKVGQVCSNTEYGIMVQVEAETPIFVFPPEVADKISEKLMASMPQEVKEHFYNFRNEEPLMVTLLLKPHTSIMTGEGTKESPYEIK